MYKHNKCDKIVQNAKWVVRLKKKNCTKGIAL